MKARYLEIVSVETGEVVHTVDVSGKSDRSVDRVFEGVLMKTDTERFFVRDTADNE